MALQPGTTAAVAVLLMCLVSGTSAVAANDATYYGGGVSREFLRGDFPATPGGYGQKVRGRLSTTSESEFVFDAGRKGAIAIPYGAISTLSYGPLWGPPPEAPRYPWSGRSHRPARNYLQIHTIRDALDLPTKMHGLVFELGRETVRPIVDALEHRTGLKTAFFTVDACLQAKSRDQCGYGDPGLLKGKVTVFLDVGGSDVGGWNEAGNPEGVATEARQEIVSAIGNARLGLHVVSEPEEASIIVVFDYHRGCKGCAPMGAGPDDAAGEVYVVDGNGLVAVMLFDESWSLFRTKLAARFANQFLQAYKRANAIGGRR